MEATKTVWILKYNLDAYVKSLDQLLTITPFLEDAKQFADEAEAQEFTKFHWALSHCDPLRIRKRRGRKSWELIR